MTPTSSPSSGRCRLGTTRPLRPRAREHRHDVGGLGRALPLARTGLGGDRGAKRREGRHNSYKVKLAEVAKDTGIKISLAAFVKGDPAGFLMGRLYYGEFGQPEPVPILDSMGVSTVFAGQHVGAALMRQLEMNLSALGIERLQTQVEWDQVDLIKFFQRAGFRPAARLCLEKPVKRPVG